MVLSQSLRDNFSDNNTTDLILLLATKFGIDGNFDSETLPWMKG